jgi:copper(I)-binding protein
LAYEGAMHRGSISFFAAALLALAPVAALAAPPQLRIEKPWIRYLLPGIPAAGYMVLRNTGDTIAVLTGAASPACGMLMLHQSQDASGMASMTEVPAVTIPARGSVTLAPGGYHLMCMQPSMKPGEKIAITLQFQDGSKLITVVPVYGAQNAP